MIKVIDEKMLNNVFGIHLSAATRDAFGRLRVSQPITLFDSKQIVDNQPLFFDDQQTSGTGTSSTYTAAKAASVLAVSNTTAGTRVRQTFRRFNYQPGKSQNAYITFTGQAPQTGITRRVGLFDANNGVFLEQTSAGMFFVVRNGASDTRIPQSLWNTDRCDGTGTSGVFIDLSKSQIFFVDFEWLGVGIVRYGFVVNGAFITAHVQQHSNIVTAVYHVNPNLPIRYEISNSGAGPAATLDAICCAVMSEGGVQRTGYDRSIDRGQTALTTLNNANTYPLLGIRLKSNYLMASIAIQGFSTLCTSTAVYRYVLSLNPTFTGVTPSWTPIANSAVEYSTPANTTTLATEGQVIHSGYDSASTSTTAADSSLGGNLEIGSAIDGTQQQLWISVARITGTTETFYAALNWHEQI